MSFFLGRKGGWSWGEEEREMIQLASAIFTQPGLISRVIGNSVSEVMGGICRTLCRILEHSVPRYLSSKNVAVRPWNFHFWSDACAMQPPL